MTDWTVAPDSHTGAIMFESWSAAVAEASRPHANERADDSRESRRIGRDEFSGVGSFDAARKLASEGWPEGRLRVTRFSASIGDRVRSRMRRTEYEAAEYGPIFDIGAFLADDPYMMLRPFETDALSTGRGAIVKVVASLGARADVTHAVYTMRGAAVVALVDALESTGRRVDLVGTYSATRSYGDGRLDVAVQLKRPDQMLNADVLSFALAHPASLRRIGFAIRENAPTALRRHVFNDSLNGGACASAVHPLAAAADVTIGPAFYEPAWFNEASATAFVLDVLAKQGIALTG